MSAGASIRTWAAARDPWTNVYGLARTVLALGTLLTLAGNEMSTLFRPAAGIGPVPNCDGIFRATLFCVVGGQLELARWIGVAILLLVASGWRPRFTGVLHWWVCWSLQSTAITLDGGDQVAAVLTLLLLPVTLTDGRRWHWFVTPTAGGVWASVRHAAAAIDSDPPHRSPDASDRRRDAPRIVALSTMFVIRLQVAMIYFQSSTSKFSSPEWANGTAMYYFWTDPLLGAPHWLRPLLEPILTSGPLVVALTYGALIFEVLLFLGLVIDERFRGPLLWTGIAFHGGIALVHGLISFAFAMSAALILFLRPWWRPFRVPLEHRQYFRRPAARLQPQE